MHTIHTCLPLADHILHVVDFTPESFHEHDLLWLPHHAQLQSSGRKRKAEHLAGRIAAVHALRAYGHHAVPGIGKRRQPVWPGGLSGSISHCATTALAVVSRRPAGVDLEEIFTPPIAAELASSIVSEPERALLESSGLPFELALTLAFSAKESGFKATPGVLQPALGFLQYRIVKIQQRQILLHGGAEMYRIRWLRTGSRVITLCIR